MFHYRTDLSHAVLKYQEILSNGIYLDMNEKLNVKIIFNLLRKSKPNEYNLLQRIQNKKR